LNKSNITNISVIVIFFVISIVISEILIRLLIGPPSYFFYTASFTDKQNNWNINYEIIDILRTNCDNKKVDNKIAVIGDSFVFGQGVDNCDDFVSKLNEKSDKYSFYNFGLIGVGANEYSMVVRDFLDDSYNAAIIVFYGNDISDLKNYKDRSLLGIVADKSSILSLIRKYKRSRSVEVKVSNMGNENNFDNNVISVIKNNPSYFYDTDYPGLDEKLLFEKQFNALSSELAKKNINNIYIAVVPGGENLSRELHEFIINNGGKTAEFGINSESYRFIKDLSDQNNYIFIDTFNEFSKNGDKYYFENDLHWNEHGHKLMSEIIIQNIK